VDVTEKTYSLRSLKCRIYPNKDQEDHLIRYFGVARFVYNQLLDKTNTHYTAYKESIREDRPSYTKYGLAQLSTIIRSEYPFVNEAPQRVSRYAAFALADSFESFFKKKGKYPRFRSKRDQRQSFTLDGGYFGIENGRLILAKTPGSFRLHGYRHERFVKTVEVTVSRSPTGKYYASITGHAVPRITNGADTVGIDLGITHFAVLSDGTKIENPRYLDRTLPKLRKYQRQFARKTKGSRRWHKAKLRVAKTHERITNQRNDFLHKLSRVLVDQCRLIGVEGLQVQNMMRNRNLSRHIAQAGWSTFLNMLQHKTEESRHATLIRTDTWYPSTQTCHICHERNAVKLKLSDRTWSCDTCGAVHDRDINAAKNILHQTSTALGAQGHPGATVWITA
jgi:putative transposase